MARRQPRWAGNCFVVASGLVSGCLLASLAFVEAPPYHAVSAVKVARQAFTKLESRKQISAQELTKSKQAVREILLNKNGAPWLWQMFCTEKGLKNADLIDAPAQLVEQFLSSFKRAHDAVRWASKDLICELNEERNTPMAQWHWANYCERNCFSIRNPYNLPAEVVKDFLDRYREGAFGEVGLCSEEVASQAKYLQKKGGTEQWKRYVRNQGFQSLDPLSYPESFVQGFVESFDHQNLDDNAPRDQILSSRSILNSALARLLTDFARGEVTYELEERDTKNARLRATLVLPERARDALPDTVPMEFVGEWQRNDGAAAESAAREAVTTLKILGLA